MRKISKIIIGLLTILGVLNLSSAQAATVRQTDLNGHVYIASYLNANALRTSYHYIFFTRDGRAITVPVADVDASGKPLIDEAATKKEQQGPAKVKQYTDNRQLVERQAKERPVRVLAKNKISVKANGVKAKPLGTIQKKGNSKDFTVTYPDGAQKYTSIRFKLAPANYQYK